jgi:hypothetical protein
LSRKCVRFKKVGFRSGHTFGKPKARPDRTVKFYVEVHNYNYWGSSRLKFKDRKTGKLLREFAYNNAPFWTGYLNSSDILIEWYPGMAYCGGGTGYRITQYNYY